MRGAIAWTVVVTAACGSVNENDRDASQDMDADGDAAPVAPGTIKWARSLSSVAPTGCVEGAGGLVVVGYITAPADLGGEILTPTATDTVVAGFAVADAAHVYSTRFGGAGQEYGFLDTVEPQGSPIIAGVAYGDMTTLEYDLGQGPLTSGSATSATSDGFVGRYGPTGPAWVKRAVGPGEDKLVDTAIGGSAVFAIGWYETSTMLDTMPFTSAGGRDILFTRFNSFTGEVQIARSFGSVSRQEAGAVATLGADVVAAGFFDGTFTLADDMTSAGGLDVWVARFTADGSPVWNARFGGTMDDRGPSLITDAAGDIYLTGTFSDQVGFGGVNLIAAGMTDIFIAKLRGNDGGVVWAKSIGSTGIDQPGRIALDPRSGAIVVAGSVGGEVEPGGDYNGLIDTVIAAYDPDAGDRRWLKILGTAGDDRGGAVGVGSDGIYAAFGLGGPIDVGVPIIGAPSPAGIVLKIEP